MYLNLYILYICCFILMFTSSSPCRKDRLAVSYFSTSLIVLQVIGDVIAGAWGKKF